MKTENKVGNLDNALQWAAGAAIAGLMSRRRWWSALGLLAAYTAVRAYRASAEGSKKAPAKAEPHPYFDPHHKRHQEAKIPTYRANEHRTQVGNGPGERNQIGGRASGKKARY